MSIFSNSMISSGLRNSMVSQGLRDSYIKKELNSGGLVRQGLDNSLIKQGLDNSITRRGLDKMFTQTNTQTNLFDDDEDEKKKLNNQVNSGMLRNVLGTVLSAGLKYKYGDNNDRQSSFLQSLGLLNKE